ncbi:MAG: hypothetical protein KDD62_08965, partial [Bdellovibrionales bacterium]|nr:hypothetical protein [Bdellovibrionales bacterium]
MTKFCGFYKSTIGKKVVVSVTGVMLYGFVVGHMLGNLKTFGGFDSAGIHKLDHYAHFLRVVGKEMAGYAGVLWATRLGLLAAAVLHVVTVLQLQVRIKNARPIPYVKYDAEGSTLAART